MKRSTKRLTLMSPVTYLVRGLALLSLLAVLVLVGAGVSHLHAVSVPTGQHIAPLVGDAETPPPGATNGQIYIGG